MPTFIYKGEKKDGTSVEVTVEAKDRYAVYELARKNAHAVLSIHEKRRFSFTALTNTKRLSIIVSSVGQDEIVMFTRNLSAMLGAGLSLSRSLSIAERQTRNPKFKDILGKIGEQIKQGDQMHEALRGFPKIFPNLYIEMVRAGEAGGTLSEALKIIGIQLERSSSLRKKIRGAMIYPAIITTVMLIIGVLMMILVVPTLTKTFKELNVELPVATKVVIGISDFLTNHLVIALIGFGVFITAFISALKTKPGRRSFEFFILHLPIIGTLVRETNAARTARTLSSLLSSGVDVIGAINITGKVVQNSYYQDVIKKAATLVEKGDPLSQAFIAHEGLYPVLVGEMIAVGEETGQISQMLVEVASFYESEVERKTADLSTIIEPVLMVVIGSVVGFFALAMISPIYSISDSIV